MNLLALRRESKQSSESWKADQEELIKRQHAVAQRLHVLEWKADVIRHKEDEDTSRNDH
jgi:hypothetical protein